MVKVTIKNFKQETFQINIDESRTVADLKKELENLTNKEMTAENQTLIYAGVIMENNLPLKQYKIDEKKFIVVMLRKPIKGAGKLEDKTTKPVVPEKNGDKVPKEEKQNSASKTQPANQTYVSSDSVSDPNEIERAIKNITEMGYPKEDVIRAFRASFNNPDRAVEYLVNGIPNECLLGEPADMTAPPTSGSESNRGVSPLHFLRSNPRFQQMKQLLRANPDMLNTLLSQIGQTNPGLLQMITENQEEFVELLNEEAPGSVATDSTDDEYDLDDLEMSPRQSDSITINVTPQEREAINRLKALGFPEELVIQAYFACDKDEQQAANFLLSQNDD